MSQSSLSQPVDSHSRSNTAIVKAKLVLDMIEIIRNHIILSEETLQITDHRVVIPVATVIENTSFKLAMILKRAI
jgi:hypothetical protein